MPIELKDIPTRKADVSEEQLQALLLLANTIVDDYDFWREDNRYPEVEAAIELTKSIRQHCGGK